MEKKQLKIVKLMLEKENIEHTPEKERKWHNNSRTKVQTIVNQFSSFAWRGLEVLDPVQILPPLKRSQIFPLKVSSYLQLIYKYQQNNVWQTWHLFKLARSSSIDCHPAGAQGLGVTMGLVWEVGYQHTGPFTCGICHETKHWRRFCWRKFLLS